MKTALITGGASGLGRELALQYTAQGFEVAIADLNQERAESVVEEITHLGGKAFFVTCDIANEDSIESMKAILLERWQGIDVLINNAGVATGGALEYEDIESWQWVININVLGMVRVCRALIPDMKKQGGAKVINIASQAALTPAPFMGSYNVSKASVVSFSETMYFELIHDDIQVSVACPSFFATNLKESLRTAQPGIDTMVASLLSRSDITAKEVAQQIFEGSEQGRFMIVTHKAGRSAFRMKRWLPDQRYLNMMLKKLKNFKPHTQRK